MILAALLLGCSLQVASVIAGEGAEAPASLSAAPAASPAAQTPESARRTPPSRGQSRLTPGIYPVYDIGGHWVLMDRLAKGSRRSIKLGSSVLVIGSKAADIFSVAKTSDAWGAACPQRKPVRTPAFLLSGKGIRRVGTPIVAIAVTRGARVDPSNAKFFHLEDQVSSDAYSALSKAIQGKVMEELRSGEFPIDPEDAMGRTYAQNPDPDHIHLKIDMGASVKLAGVSDAFAVVEGVEVSKTYRRCLRLFLNDKPAGRCAEMPHALMAETNLLSFVAYDPNGAGSPFVLAYTSKEPLWGHERWGFRITKKGPTRFLMDALDPKCRDRF